MMMMMIIKNEGEGYIGDGMGGINEGENDKSQYLPLVGVEREGCICSSSTMLIRTTC